MNHSPPLKAQIQNEMKSAMREKDQSRLNTIRFLFSKIKQHEIDNKTTPDDSQTITIIEKLIKQHNEAIIQYKKANREDLIEKEQSEMKILQLFLPTPLTEKEIDTLINNIITSTQASSMRDMGKVMGELKEITHGRADIALLSSKVKTLLSK